MSIGSVTNSSAAQQWQAMQRARASKTEAAPDSSGGNDAASANSFPTDLKSMPYDEMSVTLPGGLTLGIVHFGSNFDSATEAQMVKSMEQLVGGLSGYTPPAGASSASDQTNSDAAANTGQGSLDAVHVDLPGGLSLDVRHGSPTAESDNDAASIQDRLVKEMTDLVAALKAYSGTPSSGAAGSPPPPSASGSKVA